MRKKIKQLMNKEEGFTLVELLAVIVILGIILAIAIPSVGGIINRAQDNADAAEKDLIVEAARMYVMTEYDNLSFDGDTETVDSDTLAEQGYLENRDDKAITNTVVTITKTDSDTDSEGAATTDSVKVLEYSVPE